MDIDFFASDEKKPDEKVKESKKRSSEDAFGFNIGPMFPKRHKPSENDENEEKKEVSDETMLVNSMFADMEQKVDNSENYDEKMRLNLSMISSIEKALSYMFSVPYKSDDAFVIFEFLSSGMVLTANSTQMFSQFTLSSTFLGDNYTVSKDSSFDISVSNAIEVFKTGGNHISIYQNAEDCEYEDFHDQPMYDPGSSLIVEFAESGSMKARLLCTSNTNALGDSRSQNIALREMYNEKVQVAMNTTPVLLKSKVLENILKVEEKNDKNATVMLTLNKIRGQYKYMVSKKSIHQSYSKNFYDVEDDNIEDKFARDDESKEFVVYKFTLSDVNTLKSSTKVSQDAQVYFMKEGILVIYYLLEEYPSVTCSTYLRSNTLMAN